MAKFTVFLRDDTGNPLTGKLVQLKQTGTSTIVASTRESDTGGSVTIVDLGDGNYTTTGSYSSYLSSGSLVTGSYDVYVNGSLLPELTNQAHVNPGGTDLAGQLFEAWYGWGHDRESASLCYMNAQGSFTFSDVSILNTLMGLGGAAALNVGTGSGTVAAGNHTHTGSYLPLDASGLPILPEVTSLPPASSSYYRRMMVVLTGDSCKVYICLRTELSHSWVELGGNDWGGTPS